MKKNLTCLLLLICMVTAYGKTNEKPNFIIILADDLGFGDLSMNGSKQIRTPNIDALAETGVRFSQAYVSSAVCSPSRAGLITGKNQVEFGHDNNLSQVQKGFDKEFNGMPISEKTIATRLKGLGYTTGLIGKWHLGVEGAFHPIKRGFDEFWGYTAGGHDYFESKPDGKGYMAPIESNFKTPQKITYITDDKGDECVDFISRHSDEPFFLFASFNAPHTPMQALDKDLDLYKDIKNKRRRTYAAMVHRLDINVGKIVERLKKEKLSENTVVIFLSDNGGPAQYNSSCNAPFNGQKGILLDGGIHVPFVMNWPTHLPEGKVYDNPISSLDIAPTFYELAGGVRSEKQFSGVNLIPYLSENSVEVPHENLMWKFTISAAIREGNWKLIRIPDSFPMLFDLSTDVSEQNDLALEQPEVAKRLLKKLGYWDVRLPHPVFMEGAQWKKNQLKLYYDKYILEQPTNE